MVSFYARRSRAFLFPSISAQTFRLPFIRHSVKVETGDIMRVIKYLFLCILLAVSLCSVPTSAHSGGTDKNGGHYDRSTGEYHYHHGYGPHDHYDMDGDGDKDCPYEFDMRVKGISSASEAYDKGYSAGKKSGFDEGKEAGYAAGMKDATNEAEIKIAEAKEAATKSAYMVSLFYGAPIVAFLAHCLAKLSFNKQNQVLEMEIQKLKQELNIQKNKVILQSIQPGASIPSDIPADVSLNLSCTPTKGIISRERPYGDYTVYTTASGKKYHCKYKCCNATKAVHLFQIPSGLGPCSNCVPSNMRLQKSPSWYIQINNELSKS